MHDPYDLAQTGEVLEIHGDVATVDLGGGTLIKAKTTMTDTNPGDYVLVHAGYIIRVIDVEEGKRLLDRWRR